MALRIVTYKICDGHLHGAEEEIPGETTNPFVIDGKPMVMEICEECKDVMTFRLFVEFLKEYGREETGDEPRKSRVQSKKTRDVPCSFCDRMFTSNQGRVMHERRSHTEEFAAREQQAAELFNGDPADTPDFAQQEAIAGEQAAGDIIVSQNPMHACPDCDKSYVQSAGLDKHRQKHHPQPVSEETEAQSTAKTANGKDLDRFPEHV